MSICAPTYNQPRSCPDAAPLNHQVAVTRRGLLLEERDARQGGHRVVGGLDHLLANDRRKAAPFWLGVPGGKLDRQDVLR